MFQTDEDFIYLYSQDGARCGWFRLIYGNDGWDVVNDYSTNMQEIMDAVEIWPIKVEMTMKEYWNS